MKKRIYHFNLIEIVLTVAVIAFGVVVILGMLPKGLRATRNAAAVSYASGVIEQLGGYLQSRGLTSNGTDNIECEDFDENFSAVDEKDILNNYTKLAEYIYRPNDLPIKTAAETEKKLGDKFKPFSTGVFKYADAKDVYVIVMGDSREIDGERENRLDFSGMIRVCMQKEPEIKVAAITHNGVAVANDPDSSHECFNSDGDQQCGLDSDDFTARKVKLNGAVIYMELSYPLSLPYAERTKTYYSFDVKK
ncbi:MAG: hypothetical protein E7056_02230 [Lentisphaerae bacterium]|nr:hypothetical protein [Lentisphaerota bacterium]